MNDPRLTTLAKLLLHHSCRLKPGDHVLIEAFDLPDFTLIDRLVELATEMGAVPMVDTKSNAVLRSLYLHATESSMKLAGECERFRMEKMDAYIGVRGAWNSTEFADVPAEKMALFSRYWSQPVHFEVRVPKTRWVVLRYPNPSMAQQARTSTAAFEDFFFNVCTVNYAAMAEALVPLKRRMEDADQVHITAPGTDLRFSIKDIPVVPCAGECNIPDGEIFTAPVRDSVNGTIRFNTPANYTGALFDGITLTFKEGKIVEATCQGDSARLNSILDRDEGARYIGEWSLGCNNQIVRPMGDTLFDEKIGGSFHLTPGNAYDDADNGNRSQVHWDMVLIQTPAFGGGEIYFDGELLRKNGRFIPNDLQRLNEGLA